MRGFDDEETGQIFTPCCSSEPASDLRGPWRNARRPTWQAADRPGSRQIARRAREKFAEILVDEAQTLVDPTLPDLEQELIDVDLYIVGLHRALQMPHERLAELRPVPKVESNPCLSGRRILNPLCLPFHHSGLEQSSQRALDRTPRNRVLLHLLPIGRKPAAVTVMNQRGLDLIDSSGHGIHR